MRKATRNWAGERSSASVIETVMVSGRSGGDLTVAPPLPHGVDAPPSEFRRVVGTPSDAFECHSRTCSCTRRESLGLPSGRPLEYRRQLLTYELCRADIRYVAGAYQVTREIIEDRGRTWAFVTVLRDPVARFISNLFYSRREGFPASANSDLDAFLGTEDG